MRIRSQRPLKLLMDQKHDTHLFVEVNQDKINLQVLHLYILLKMGAYEQEKCVMLSNEINLEIDIYYCLINQTLIA